MNARAFGWLAAAALAGSIGCGAADGNRISAPRSVAPGKADDPNYNFLGTLPHDTTAQVSYVSPPEYWYYEVELDAGDWVDTAVTPVDGTADTVDPLFWFFGPTGDLIASSESSSVRGVYQAFYSTKVTQTGTYQLHFAEKYQRPVQLTVRQDVLPAAMPSAASTGGGHTLGDGPVSLTGSVTLPITDHPDIFSGGQVCGAPTNGMWVDSVEIPIYLFGSAPSGLELSFDEAEPTIASTGVDQHGNFYGWGGGTVGGHFVLDENGHPTSTMVFTYFESRIMGPGCEEANVFKGSQSVTLY